MTKEERRQAAAQRKQRQREKQKKQADPVAFAAEQAAVEEKAKIEAISKAQEAQKAADELSLLKQQLEPAIAGLATMLAEAAKSLLLRAPSSAPCLGNERATELGRAWAPILAPYIQQMGSAKYLPLIVASAGTVGIVGSWAAEVKAYKKEHEHAEVMSDEAQAA